MWGCAIFVHAEEKDKLLPRSKLWSGTIKSGTFMIHREIIRSDIALVHMDV